MNSILIEVPNWESYNPRTDRASHTWFRLQNTIATEPKFFGLTASQKFIAICLFAEVSKSNKKDRIGKAEIIIEWLADQLKVSEQEILTTIGHLNDTGVIRLPRDTDRLPTDTLRTNGRTDITNERTNDGESTSATASPSSADADPIPIRPVPLQRIWNENCGTLSKVSTVSSARSRHATARWRENPDEAYWRVVVIRIADSKFCRGTNDRGWRATFDWLLKPDTHARVLEGKYDDRGSQKAQPDEFWASVFGDQAQGGA